MDLLFRAKDETGGRSGESRDGAKKNLLVRVCAERGTTHARARASEARRVVLCVFVFTTGEARVEEERRTGPFGPRIVESDLLEPRAASRT